MAATLLVLFARAASSPSPSLRHFAGCHIVNISSAAFETLSLLRFFSCSLCRYKGCPELTIIPVHRCRSDRDGWPPYYHIRYPSSNSFTMASQTLRPHRSPSPTPSPQMTPVNPANPAKLTRQSLGPPPTASSGAAKGFAGLGISSPSYPHPRHVSSSVALGLGSGVMRDSPSPRPSLGSSGNRVISGSTGRPSSEFLPSGVGREAKTPEGELDFGTSS